MATLHVIPAKAGIHFHYHNPSIQGFPIALLRSLSGMTDKVDE